MTPHPDDVTILFLDYDVIIFDDVNLYGIVTSLCPCVPNLLLLTAQIRERNNIFVLGRHLGFGPEGVGLGERFS